MVCKRCIMVVQLQLQQLGLHPISVQLGEVEIQENKLNKQQQKQLNDNLLALGFVLLDDKRSRVIEKIKNIIIQQVHHTNDAANQNLSTLISTQLLMDYGYLSNLFSDVEGITIEKYFIQQKIEKVKELIMYDELTLSQIAFQLNYSSTAYLSSQFKKVTGFTPSHFKQLKDKKRQPIEEL